MRLRCRNASHTRTVSVESGVPWSLYLFHCPRELTGHSFGYLVPLIRYCPVSVPGTSDYTTNEKKTFLQFFLCTTIFFWSSIDYHLVCSRSCLSSIMESTITFDDSLLPSCMIIDFVFHFLFTQLQFVTWILLIAAL